MTISLLISSRRVRAAVLVGAGLAAAVGRLHAQAARPHPRAEAGTILSADQGLVLVPGDSGGGGMLLKIGPLTSGSKHVVLGSVSLLPGTGIPVHRRPQHEEVLFLHSGQATLTLKPAGAHSGRNHGVRATRHLVGNREHGQQAGHDALHLRPSRGGAVLPKDDPAPESARLRPSRASLSVRFAGK
jgi:quercetin dioxygenase-like cupin family protein